MDRKGRPEWRYKESAITTCGRMFREALNEEWLRAVTLVPIPSSKRRDEADYDDRLPRILQELARGQRFAIRELLAMTKSVGQSHLAEERVSIEELTTGRHFKAVETVLNRRFPGVPIVGMFVARRAPESTLPAR